MKLNHLLLQSFAIIILDCLAKGMNYRMCDYNTSHCFILKMLVGKWGEVTFQTTDIYTIVLALLLLCCVNSQELKITS